MAESLLEEALESFAILAEPAVEGVGWTAKLNLRALEEAVAGTGVANLNIPAVIYVYRNDTRYEADVASWRSNVEMVTMLRNLVDGAGSSINAELPFYRCRVALRGDTALPESVYLAFEGHARDEGDAHVYELVGGSRVEARLWSAKQRDDRIDAMLKAAEESVSGPSNSLASDIIIATRELAHLNQMLAEALPQLRGRVMVDKADTELLSFATPGVVREFQAKSTQAGGTGGSYAASSCILDAASPAPWSPATAAPDEYIQVELAAPRVVAGVVTQGFGPHWITKFKVQVVPPPADDAAAPAAGASLEWVDVDGGEEFEGNTDGSGHKVTHFMFAHTTRFVRLVATGCHDRAALRWGLLVLKADKAPIRGVPPPADVMAKAMEEAEKKLKEELGGAAPAGAAGAGGGGAGAAGGAGAGAGAAPAAR